MPLRQGFACGKTLVGCKSAAPLCGPRSCPASEMFGQDKKTPAGRLMFFDFRHNRKRISENINNFCRGRHIWIDELPGLHYNVKQKRS